MKSSEPNSELSSEEYAAREIMLFESRISDLMFTVASKFSGKVKSIQLMRDDDFVHRRDRTTNDIHVFLELKNGQYFHLRAYTRHMLDMGKIPEDRIFLTGYLKSSVSQTGGEHSLRQDWYIWNAEAIANEITRQNLGLLD